MAWILVGLGAAIVIGWWIFRLARGGYQKPAHLREPIAPGQFRLVADDTIGGSDLTRVVGDFPSFADALAEAAKLRRDSELQEGSKGNPTKFFIYDHAEALVGDWTGPRKAA